MPVPVFDINTFILDYIPRTKRKPYFVAWFKGLLSQMDRLNKLFNDFRTGSTDLGYWSNAVTYSTGDRVRTLVGTFESLLGGNLGNNPITDDGTKWFKVLNDFMGADKRVSFTVQKLSFEKALNDRFQGVLTDNGFVGFKQPTSLNPPDGYLPLSDIYLSYDTPSFTSFVCFSTEELTSKVFKDNTQDVIFSTELYSVFTSYVGNINIPSSVFSSLGTVDVATSIIMNFVNKYKRIGTDYKIVTY